MHACKALTPAGLKLPLPLLNNNMTEVSAATELRRKNKLDREFKERADSLLSSTRVRLKPYQREGLYEFILSRERKAQGGIIADEMGLGKTYSIAAAIKCNPMGRTLILVPCALVGQWETALSEFGLTVVTVNNADTSFPQTGRSDNTRVFLATHSCLMKKLMHAFFCSPWDRIVVDEAHILRNPDALMNINAMTLTGRVRWALTATPIQNQIEDVLSLARFVGVPDPDDAMDVCKNHMMRQTVRELEQRFKASKLPPLTCKYETLELSKQEQGVYEAITEKYAGDSMLCILRQRQACVHVAVAVSCKKKKASDIGSLQNLVSSKVQWVLEDLNRQSRVTKSLIFCTWTLEIDVIRSTLVKSGYGVLVFNGSLDTSRRQAVLNNFKLPGFTVLILQIACGSVGLNLQQATRVYIMSPGWNPTTEMQAIARTHRQGQTQAVTCTRLVAKGTVEESVMYAQQRKSKLIDEATSDDMVSSRLMLSDQDLSFLTVVAAVRPALSLAPKKRRIQTAAVDLVADCLSTVSLDTIPASTNAPSPSISAEAMTSSAHAACTATVPESKPTVSKRRAGQKAETALTKSIRLALAF